MQEIYLSDIYSINVNYPLDTISFRSIQLLYQPLLGNQAITLYLTLYAEADQIRLTKAPCLHSRLSKLTSLSLKEIYQARRKLEGVGLLHTYQKENHYLYELQLPLSPKEFFNHQILNSMLERYLDKEDYQRTITTFTYYKQSKQDFKSVTANFLDVYEIDLLEESKQPLKIRDLIDKDVASLEDFYDLNLFFEQLSIYQIPRKIINDEIERLIRQLGIMYQIPTTKMLVFVKEAISKQGLDTKALVASCRNYYDLKMPTSYQEVFHKQSIKHQSTSKNDQLQKHIEYLEQITPYDLLKHKMGGKEPLQRDVRVVESVLTTLDLEPGVVNVLIELTLNQCDNNLPKSFMEAVGSSWRRKKIQTVSDAIQEAKSYKKFKQNNSIDWKQETTTDQSSNDQTLSDDEIEKMLEMIS